MIYMLLTDGFEDIEALETLDILRRGGLEVKTVGVKDNIVMTSHSVKVFSDIVLSEVDKEKMEMLILPGGPGHTALYESEAVKGLIEYAAKNEILLAAICASPSILGKMGLLDGKKYTCFPGYEEEVRGGLHQDKKVVRDGLFITAKGAGASSEFGFEILTCFKGAECAEKLKCDMQY